MENLSESNKANGDDLLKQINIIWIGKSLVKNGRDLDFLRDALINKVRRNTLAIKYDLNPNSIYSKVCMIKSCLFDQIMNGDEKLYRQLHEACIVANKK